MRWNKQDSESKEIDNLESLLALKRLERARPEVWDRFDKENKVTMMQALVKPRRTVVAPLAQLARNALSLKGAAACLMCAFLLQLNVFSPSGITQQGWRRWMARGQGAGLPSQIGSCLPFLLSQPEACNFVRYAFDFADEGPVSFVRESSPKLFSLDAAGSEGVESVLPSLKVLAKAGQVFSY